MSKPPTLTNAEFAFYASAVAAKAGNWSRDILSDLEQINEPPRMASVETFAANIAGLLDSLSAAATRKVKGDA